MREHIKILGILNIVMGAFTALGGLAALVIMGGMAGVITASATDSDRAVAAPLIAGIGMAVGVFLLLLSLPSIIGGWGLIKFRPWSRVLMIVLSVLHLLNLPLGTALGVYGLWVLFSEEGRRILESGGQMYFPGMPYPAQGAPQQPVYPPPGV
jgi:predicted membrane-bound dolichyl-phosphate-mannose-protein mannosyltransferase